MGDVNCFYLARVVVHGNKGFEWGFDSDTHHRFYSAREQRPQ